jgi:hypothetical protein
MDGTTLLGSSPVANGSAKLNIATLSFGSHSISAVYSGDINHATSTSSSLTQLIVQAATVTVGSNLNPSDAGATVTFTARITGSGPTTPTGTILFLDGQNAIGTVSLDGTGSAILQTASLILGTHTMTASYSGDTNYSVASAVMVQTVQSASTQVTLAASANPATYATPVSFTATVTGNGGIAAGSVTFTDSGVTLGVIQLNSGGVAVLTTSSLAPGSHSVVANYGGNSSTGASISTPTVVTVKETTAVTLHSNLSPASTLAPIVLTASVSNNGVGVATGVVTFTDGPTQLGTMTLDGSGTATLTLPSLVSGNHVLQASYAGDGDNFAGVSSPFTQVVQLRPTTTTLTGSADPNNPQQVTLIAVVRWTGTGTPPALPTGTVSFLVGTGTLGSSPVDATGVATLTVALPSASASIIAIYSGDDVYATSTSLPATVTTGVPTQFTLQINPPSVTFPTKQHAAVTLEFASLSGFSDTLQLGCLGLPFAATCTFSTPQVKLGANSAADAQLTIDTGDPLGAGASATRRTSNASGVMLCLLPCLLGIAFGVRRRKFNIATSLLLLVAAAITFSSTGCSGLHINGTPPGTYTFKVTASGVNTGTTISQTMTLTVTQ